MNILKSIWAFIKGPFTEVSAMPDDLIQSGTTDSTAQAVALNASAATATLSQPGTGQVTGESVQVPLPIAPAAGTDVQFAEFEKGDIAPGLSQPTLTHLVDPDKLHAMLKVLGHDLELVWSDAVALVKKAL